MSVWLPILFTCVTLVASKKDHIECKTCVKVENLCHNISFLLDFNVPFRSTVVITQLGIHRSRNTLFFAFEPNITDPEYYKVGYVNLDRPENKGILEGTTPITNLRNFAIDQDKDTIYLGGGDAIYILDSSNKAAFYSSKGDTIQSIFFKRHLFFVRYGEYKIITKEEELFRSYEQYRNVKNFVLDRNNILVYLNISGLYANKFGTNDTVQLHRNPFFRGLTVDLDGVVYAWWIDGIYKVVIENVLEDSEVIKIADINRIGGITFDNDNNLLFSSSKGLFKLTALNTTLC